MGKLSNIHKFFPNTHNELWIPPVTPHPQDPTSNASSPPAHSTENLKIWTKNIRQHNGFKTKIYFYMKDLNTYIKYVNKSINITCSERERVVVRECAQSFWDVINSNTYRSVKVFWQYVCVEVCVEMNI